MAEVVESGERHGQPYARVRTESGKERFVYGDGAKALMSQDPAMSEDPGFTSAQAQGDYQDAFVPLASESQSAAPKVDVGWEYKPGQGHVVKSGYAPPPGYREKRAAVNAQFSREKPLPEFVSWAPQEPTKAEGGRAVPTSEQPEPRGPDYRMRQLPGGHTPAHWDPSTETRKDRYAGDPEAPKAVAQGYVEQAQAEFNVRQAQAQQAAKVQAIADARNDARSYWREKNVAAQQRQRQQEIEDAHSEVRQAIDDFKSQPAPNGKLSTGRRIALAIGQALATYGAALQGRKAPDYIGMAIQRQIADQKAELAKRQQHIQDGKNLIADLRKRDYTMKEAETAAEVAYLEQVDSVLAKRMAEARTPEMKARLEQERIRIQQTAREKYMGLQERVAGKITSSRQYTPAKSWGGGTATEIRMEDGSFVDAKTAKQLQSAGVKTAAQARGDGSDPYKGILDLNKVNAMYREGIGTDKQYEAAAKRAKGYGMQDKDAAKAANEMRSMNSDIDRITEMAAKGQGNLTPKDQTLRILGYGTGQTYVKDLWGKAKELTGDYKNSYTAQLKEAQAIMQRITNQNIQERTGAGVSANDAMRLPKETGIQTDSTGTVVGWHWPTVEKYLAKKRRENNAALKTLQGVENRSQEETSKKDALANDPRWGTQ